MSIPKGSFWFSANGLAAIGLIAAVLYVMGLLGIYAG